jgi:hypothetical protein
LEARVPSSSFFNPEQQAQLVEDMFDNGYFTTGKFVVNGQDLTAYADRALAALHSGRGAP